MPTLLEHFGHFACAAFDPLAPAVMRVVPSPARALRRKPRRPGRTEGNPARVRARNKPPDDDDDDDDDEDSDVDDDDDDDGNDGDRR